ncbi:hypothetical protein ACN47E_005995 [Coniothyrium glycines]
MERSRNLTRLNWLKPWTTSIPTMDNEHATSWLSQFIGKNLRIHTADGRVFAGQMKCTDQDRNVILALAHEYRAPAVEAIRRAVANAGNSTTTVPWNSRYVGLVVVPGEHITKIEFEESGLIGQKSSVTL